MILVVDLDRGAVLHSDCETRHGLLLLRLVPDVTCHERAARLPRSRQGTTRVCPWPALPASGGLATGEPSSAVAGGGSLVAVSWEIRANLGRHARPGVDAHGWLWEITRGTDVTHVVVEITAPAWWSDPLRLPEDTRHALQTDGRTEILKALEQDVPPRVIRCGLSGCSPLVST